MYLGAASWPSLWIIFAGWVLAQFLLQPFGDVWVLDLHVFELLHLSLQSLSQFDLIRQFVFGVCPWLRRAVLKPRMVFRRPIEFTLQLHDFDLLFERLKLCRCQLQRLFCHLGLLLLFGTIPLRVRHAKWDVKSLLDGFDLRWPVKSQCLNYPLLNDFSIMHVQLPHREHLLVGVPGTSESRPVPVSILALHSLSAFVFNPKKHIHRALELLEPNLSFVLRYRFKYINLHLFDILNFQFVIIFE